MKLVAKIAFIVSVFHFSTLSYGHVNFKLIKQAYDKSFALVKDLDSMSGVRAYVDDHDINVNFCAYDIDEEAHVVVEAVVCKDPDHSNTLRCAKNFSPKANSLIGKECKITAGVNKKTGDYTKTLNSQADEIINYKGKDKIFKQTHDRTESSLSYITDSGIQFVFCKKRSPKVISAFNCKDGEDYSACERVKDLPEDSCDKLPR